MLIIFHISASDAQFRRTYKLGPELGRGGFGTVYSGFRLRDALAVAIKFVARENVSEWSIVSTSVILDNYELHEF